MSLNHTYTFGVKVPGLPSLPADPSIIIPGDVDVPVEVTVPSGQVVHVAHLNVLKANLQSVVLNSSGDMTCFTNSANGTGGQTIALTKGNSVAWNVQENQTLFPNPITHDITDLYLDNSAGTADFVFRGAFLLNY